MTLIDLLFEVPTCPYNKQIEYIDVPSIGNMTGEFELKWPCDSLVPLYTEHITNGSKHVLLSIWPNVYTYMHTMTINLDAITTCVTVH